MVQKALSTALVVNPIAAALAGFSLIWAFCAWFCSSRAFAIVRGSFLDSACRTKGESDCQVTFITLLLSDLFGWIAFAVDVALAVIARNRMRDAFQVDGTIGNGVWMAFGGAVSRSVYPTPHSCYVESPLRLRLRSPSASARLVAVSLGGIRADGTREHTELGPIGRPCGPIEALPSVVGQRDLEAASLRCIAEAPSGLCSRTAVRFYQ